MKKKHRIFKSIVAISNQKECDKLREVCEKHKIPVWKDVDKAFAYVDYYDQTTYLKYDSEKDASDKDHVGFFIDAVNDEDDFDIVSMEEFEALAEDYNPQFKSIDDVLSKIKELNNLLNNKNKTWQ